MSDASLTEFVPMTRRVDLGAGRQVLVSPLTLRTFPAYTKAVQPILPLLLSGQIVVALVENPEALIGMVSVATGIAPDDMPQDPAVFIELAAAVTEVNSDFFVRRLLPASRAAGGAILAAVRAASPAGEPSSPGSASAVTASTASSD